MDYVIVAQSLNSTSFYFKTIQPRNLKLLPKLKAPAPMKLFFCAKRPSPVPSLRSAPLLLRPPPKLRSIPRSSLKVNKGGGKRILRQLSHLYTSTF